MLTFLRSYGLCFLNGLYQERTFCLSLEVHIAFSMCVRVCVYARTRTCAHSSLAMSSFLVDSFHCVECWWQQTDFLWHRRCCVWMESIHRKKRDRMCAQVLQLQLCYHLPWFQDYLCCWIWSDPQGDCRFFRESPLAPPLGGYNDLQETAPCLLQRVW